LFHEMTEQGLAADRVAYNALFTALRVAGKCDKAFELWQEMVGKQAPNRDVVATARNDDSASPDIITVTEVVGALTREQSNEKIDTVFDEAVQLGIVLRSDSFDTNWEVDLTKMSLSVARAACRFVLKRAAVTCQQGRDVEELVFITGVGRNMNITQTSLRDFVKDILLTEFEPPLASSVPRLASGTVVVDKETMSAWIRSQS
jgi:pentatricopeptide repeat protein